MKRPTDIKMHPHFSRKFQKEDKGILNSSPISTFSHLKVLASWHSQQASNHDGKTDMNAQKKYLHCLWSLGPCTRV